MKPEPDTRQKHYVKRIAATILHILRDTPQLECNSTYYTELEALVKERYLRDGVELTDEEAAAKVEAAALTLAVTYLSGKEVFASLYSRCLFDMLHMLIAQEI